MDAIQQLISQATAKNKDLTPLTVRVPESVKSFIDEFCENLTLSRQEVLLTLLESGIDVAKTRLEETTVAEKAGTYHILNTNKGHGDDDHDMMMSEGIAAAFYEPWKHNIDRIKANDWVFLYQNRRGIVAYGQGTGNTQIRMHEGAADECHYQELDGFTVLAKPLTASEIKAVLGRNQIFLKVMSRMPDGQKVLERVQSMPVLNAE